MKIILTFEYLSQHVWAAQVAKYHLKKGQFTKSKHNSILGELTFSTLLGKPSLKKYWNFMNFFFTKWGGSTGFHISYSEMVITAKLVGKSEYGFHKCSTGGRGGAGHRFVKVFHKIPVFF